MKQFHYVRLVRLVWLYSFDLTQLTTFIIESESFYESSSLSLASLTDYIQFIRSSEIGNILYWKQCIL